MTADRDDLERRLDALKAQMADKREEVAQNAAPQRDASGVALAFRLGSEFVAGVLVGAGMGWGFDHMLGTAPWGMIVFLLLGFVAGMVNLVRAGKAENARRESQEAH